MADEETTKIILAREAGRNDSKDLLIKFLQKTVTELSETSRDKKPTSCLILYDRIAVLRDLLKMEVIPDGTQEDN